MKCGWIGDKYDSFAFALCSSVTPNFAIVALVILLISLLGIFVSCCGGCIAIRLKAEMWRKIRGEYRQPAKEEDAKP